MKYGLKYQKIHISKKLSEQTDEYHRNLNSWVLILQLYLCLPASTTPHNYCYTSELDQLTSNFVHGIITYRRFVSLLTFYLLQCEIKKVVVVNIVTYLLIPFQGGRGKEGKKGERKGEREGKRGERGEREGGGERKGRKKRLREGNKIGGIFGKLICTLKMKRQVLLCPCTRVCFFIWSTRF